MEFKKKINRQGIENMAADVIGEEEEITSEPVFEILKSNTDMDMDMVSRLGIVLPDNQILKPDKTLANPVNGITFDELNGKAAFITNMEPDNLETDKFVLFLNVTIERENKPVGVLFGVIEPESLSDYFEVNIFDGNAEVFLVDAQNRELIMDTLHGEKEKAGALEGHKIKKGYDEGQITRDFAKGAGGVTAYYSTSLKEYLYSAYEPVGINDWFVMVTVPESIVFRETKYIEKVLFGLGFYEAIVLIAYFLLDIVRTRKEIQAKEKMATTDLLTGLRNRNAYEQTLAQYEAQLPACLACIYADANGLRELNNSQGHAAGDRMLKTVADTLAEVFGEGKVYRIGGDEFLAFAEMDLDSASKEAQEAKEKVVEEGYYVSIGAASGEEYGDIAAVIKVAEQRMYVDKKRYYMEHGDRVICASVNIRKAAFPWQLF